MKRSTTGENVTERITINKEPGIASYNKCGQSCTPGNVECVIAITPLSLDFYDRRTSSGMRLDWKAPYAKQVESETSGTVGYGLASKPVIDMSQDSLWKAMIYAMRNPAECGLKVDGVTTRDMAGFMQRTMRSHEKPGRPTVTDNAPVMRPRRRSIGWSSTAWRQRRSGSSPCTRALCGSRCAAATPRARCAWIGEPQKSVCLPIFDSTIAAAQRTWRAPGACEAETF